MNPIDTASPLGGNLAVGEPIGPALCLDPLAAVLDRSHIALDDRPGCWRLSEGHFGTRFGRLLIGAAAQRAPVLNLRGPAQAGRYAIFATLFSPAGRQFGLYLRPQQAKHFAYVQCLRHEPALERLYVLTLDLPADATIQIACFDRDAALDCLEFVPVRGGGRQTLGQAGKGKVIGILDFADDAGISRPQDFEAGAAVRRHHEVGYDIVMWKAYAVRCEYHTRVGTMRSASKTEVAGPRDGLASSNAGIAELLARYDTMRQAADEAKALGMDLFGWLRINNEFSRANHHFSPDTPFHLANPDKFQLNRDGKRSCKLSFAYPEVRQHKLDLLAEIARYGMAGMFIDVLRHPPLVQFDAPIVEAYLARTGKDPRLMPNDGSEDWLRFRAEVFTSFLTDCRRVLDELSPQRRLPLYVRTVDQPWYNLVIGCDVDAWIDRRLVDGIIFGPWCAEANNYPDQLDLTSYIRRSRGSVEIFGQVWRYGSGPHALAMADDLYQQGVDGVAVYESNATVANDWFCRNLWRLKGKA